MECTLANVNACSILTRDTYDLNHLERHSGRTTTGAYVLRPSYHRSHFDVGGIQLPLELHCHLLAQFLAGLYVSVE